ncbi:acyl-CoA N-acyltransferase [Aspergillus pseudoustus]|uniref:N-alpha-acetyltransferase 40 n=1 Tax=Aspergillus pseudoustus TaxID=1810923 RepID=A0ABR4L0T8_9EURO
MPADASRSAKKFRTGTKIRSKKRESDKPKPLPLVERTNALSLEEFVSLYIPSSQLRIHKAGRKNQSHPSTTHSQGQFEHDQHKPEESDASPYTYTLDVYTASTIPAADLNACFNLIELTSSAAYKASSMGWSATEKRKEMKLPDMKYMILRWTNSDANTGTGDESSKTVGQFAGFLEFMVTYEDGYEVLYCYEIHLTPELQGQGLGEELMLRFEHVGARIGLEKAMLTVFKSNLRATTFYERVGYTEDESSPRPRKLRNGTVKEADYQIMSKSLR